VSWLGNLNKFKFKSQALFKGLSAPAFVLLCWQHWWTPLFSNLQSLHGKPTLHGRTKEQHKRIKFNSKPKARWVDDTAHWAHSGWHSHQRRYTSFWGHSGNEVVFSMSKAHIQRENTLERGRRPQESSEGLASNLGSDSINHSISKWA
jgi:hypothetical protein